MPTPVDDKTKAAVAKAILAGKLTPGQIAQDHQVSESFVSKLKKKLQAPGGAISAYAPAGTEDAAPAPARAPRKPRTPKAVPPTTDALLAALEPGALPALQLMAEGLRASLAGFQAKLARVEALIRLHSVPSPVLRTPELPQLGVAASALGVAAPAEGPHFRNAPEPFEAEDGFGEAGYSGPGA